MLLPIVEVTLITYLLHFILFLVVAGLVEYVINRIIKDVIDSKTSNDSDWQKVLDEYLNTYGADPWRYINE